MPDRLKLYLAGPMRGIEHFNFPAFFDAASELRKQGHIVRSPAENDLETFPDFDFRTNSLSGFDLHTAYKWDIDQIFWCQGIVLLPGWSESTGTAGELSVARALNKMEFEYTNGVLIEMEDTRNG